MDKRGSCIKCGRRTRHVVEGKYLCIYCDVGLEEKITKAEEEIISIVNDAQLSPKELKSLLEQKPGIRQKVYDHSSSGRIRIGIISDTHIGHEKFDEGLFKYAGEVFRKEKIKNVYHAGDILEGMSGRDGNVFELSQVGFSRQITYAKELFSKYFKGLKVFAIQGNHDNWYKIRNNGGIVVGEELQNRLGKDKFEYLGECEADIKLADNVVMKLFHPGDGTAYATSYKLQKLIESLEGGTKPKIIIEGHYHKALYMFNRGVHGIEAGTICSQTGWMRGKKIPAQKGFYILDIETDKRGIKSFTPKFYPAYD